MENDPNNKFSVEELEVAGILVDLPMLIAESERRSPPMPVWGAKRRRTAVEFPPSPSPPRASSSHPPPSLNPPAVCSVGERPTVKVEASSSTTPLPFSASESDVKHNHSKRKLKTRYEKLTEIMMNLTVENKILKKVIENRMLHYNNLKAFNLKCKERLRELTLKGEESNLNPSRSTIRVKEVTEFTGTCPACQEEQQGPIKIVQHTPLFIDKRMHVSKVLENGQSPKSLTKSSILENGQQPKSPTKSRNSFGLELGIPDVNDMPKEGIGMMETEHFPAFSLNKTAAAAEARRIRIGILRLKKADKPC